MEKLQNHQRIQPISLEEFSKTFLGIDISPKQREWVNNSTRLINILRPGNQFGKLVPVDTPILTPVGWKPIGEIKVGDTVYSDEGKETRVLGVYPQGKKKQYKFIFDDETEVLSGWEHLWYCQTPSNRFVKNYNEEGKEYPNREYGKWSVLNTGEIIKRWGLNPKPKNRISIPTVKPIEFPEKKVPIEPYKLGLLLGDGCLGSGISLSTADKEIIDEFPDYARSSKYDYRIHGISKIISDLGLRGLRSWQKFIPDEYLFNSVNNRIDILRGLMDTDGNVQENGNIEYSTTSERLKNGVVFLVQSLGGKVKVEERFTKFTYKGIKKTGRKSFRLSIKISINPFRLLRKAERFRITERTYNRVLRKIIPCKSVESVCITVDNERGLFVIKDFIITHNTTIEAIKHIYHAMTKPNLAQLNLPPEGWLRTEYPTLNFGKTYEVAKAVYHTMIDIANGDFLIYDPKTGEAHTNKSLIAKAVVEVKENPLPYIKWWNNSITLIRSYDDLGTSFKAKKIAFISGDEVGDIPELILFINTTLLPRLVFFQGRLDIVGTPQNVGDYQELIEIAWKGDKDYYLMGGTMYDNPHLNPDYVRKIEEIADPDLRRRMIYGEFVEAGERFFPIVDVMNACKLDVKVTDSGWIEDPEPHGRYILSYDPAAANDNAAIGVIRYDVRPYRLVYKKVFKGNQMALPMQYELVTDIFIRLKDIKSKVRFIYDEGGLGGKNVEAYLTELNGYGFPGKGHSYVDTKAEALARLKDVLERGREVRLVDGKEVDVASVWGGLILPNDRNLRIELEGYKLDDKKIKNDQVMMLAMAVWMIERLNPRLQHKSAVDFDVYESM